MNVKADRPDHFPAVKIPTKTLRIMKLTAIILLAGSMAVSAHGRAQERVTLHLKGVTLETVLDRIQEQTGYNYIFSDKEVRIARKLDVDVKGATIQAVLDSCLKDLPVTYEITRRMIKIMNRAKAVSVERELEGPGPNVLVLYVLADDGTRLVGATVTIKALGVESITDENGRVEVKKIPSGTYTVEISYVGYQKTEEVVVVKEQRQVATVGLKKATTNLDEVQIIAYGATTERLNTGDVTTVNSKEISEQPVSNPMLTLEGRVPGLLVTQSTGVPGSGLTIRVQGQNSLTSGNDPLYVIDGVPYGSQLLPNISSQYGILGGNGNTNPNIAAGGGNPLTFLNPADISL